MVTRLSSLLVAFMLLLLSASSSVNAAVPELVLLSKDKKMQVTLPGEWKQRPTGKDSHQLSATLPGQAAYMLLISEPKEDFKDIKAYSKIVTTQMSQSLEEAQVSESTEVKVNGQEALRFQIRGIVDGMRVVYVLTVLETQSRFNQVLGWTSNSKLADNKQRLESLPKGVKELS